MKAISLIILFISSSIIIAQSRAEYYPLQIGNKWFYKTTDYEIQSSPPTISYYLKEVIGDTIMENGIKYFTLLEKGRKRYERFDTLTNAICNYSTNGSVVQDVPIYSLNYIKDSMVVWKAPFSSMTYKITFSQQTPSDTSYIILNGDGLMWEYVSFKKNIGINYKSVTEGGQFNTNLIGTILNGKEWGILTSVNTNKNIVTDYKLEQNYPNPFNLTTIITYDIPLYTHVKIIVYNSLGQMIRILQDQYVSPGSYKLNFNAGSLASGVYYYQLLAGEKVLTKKLILIK